MKKTSSAVTDIYCPRCQSRYDIDSIQSLCSCGAPLLIDYDYQKAASTLTSASLLGRAGGMWKYEEVLPVKVRENIITLGEGGTPLLPSRLIGPGLGMDNLFLKDETVNPTGSFKARGLGMAVSRAKELGIKRLIIPTAGNAGSALAAYSARAGIECKIIMPRDVPKPFLVDAVYHGAQIEQVDGTIKDCGARAAQLSVEEGWFSIATLKEPYRIEGKKTMGYELAEQFNYNLPEIIIYPTGGGTGLIGMWKAFNEMERMGLIDSRRPKMVAVQSSGCAPIPRAFKRGDRVAQEWLEPQTLAAGLRVPGAVGDFLILEALYQSDGIAIAIDDDSIMRETRILANREGIFSSPEGGASLAAMKELLNSGFIQSSDRVVLFITGSGYKYLDILEREI